MEQDICVICDKPIVTPDGVRRLNTHAKYGGEWVHPSCKPLLLFTDEEKQAMGATRDKLQGYVSRHGVEGNG